MPIRTNLLGLLLECHADDGEWVEVHEEEHAPSVLRRALRRIAALFWR